jgi:hypothetical protein
MIRITPIANRIVRTVMSGHNEFGFGAATAGGAGGRGIAGIAGMGGAAIAGGAGGGENGGGAMKGF